MQPTEGTTYVSAIDPTFRVHVEHVTPADDGFFTVETCDPAARDDMRETGREYDSEEWHELTTRLSLHPE